MPDDLYDPIVDRERADEWFGADQERWPYTREEEPEDDQDS